MPLVPAQVNCTPSSSASRSAMASSSESSCLSYGAMSTDIQSSSLAANINARLQTVFVAANFLVILVTIIALPLTAEHRNSSSYVFNNVQNYSEWPTGFVFLLSWLCPAWTIGGFDSAIHVAEEASNASTAVPYAIVGACGIAGLLGWFLTIVIAYCANPDYDTLLSSAQPMATIYLESFGRKPMLAIWCCIILIQFSMGSSIM